MSACSAFKANGKPRSKSESDIDIGDKATGKGFDEVHDIDCPVCDVPMSRARDAEQSHIWVEVCDRCNGIFFDAGELSDLKYKTMADWVRGRVKSKRADEGPEREIDLSG